MPGLSTLGSNSRPHNQFCGKTAHSPRFYFSLKSARQLQGTFSILCKSSKAAVLIDHVACGSGFGVMKSLGFEELYICTSPKAPVFCCKLPWLFKA